MLLRFGHGALVNHISPCPPHQEEGGSMGPASPECCCWQSHALSLNRELGPSPATPFSAGIQCQADAQAPSHLPWPRVVEGSRFRVYLPAAAEQRGRCPFLSGPHAAESKNSSCFLMPRVLCMCQPPLESVQALTGQAQPFIAGMPLRSGHWALRAGKAFDTCSAVAAACSQHEHNSLYCHSSLLQGSAWGTEAFWTLHQ